MIPVGLTIAGSDSGGGAGIQADLKSMQANGVYGASAITAVTAQNTQEVRSAFTLPTETVAEQIDAVAEDLTVDVTKTGMLATAEVIGVVAERVRAHGLTPLVVDPVMISKTGYPLLEPEAVESLIEEILPLATLLTPNAHEAGELADLEVDTVESAREAARTIYEMGPRSVLVKGGHLIGGEEAVDTLYDGETFTTFSAPFIDTPHTHGTGCTYASAIAAHLARGRVLEEAVSRAKNYVTEAIRHGLPLGGGRGPTHHFFFLDDIDPDGDWEAANIRRDGPDR